MAVIEKWFAQDLQKPVVVHHLDGSLFSHNGNGNRIGVELYNNGVALESITGTVSGYVVVSDGTTVPCTGSKSGNKASILIPAAAYVPGNVFVSIFVTDDTTVTTVAAMQSTVLQTRTGTQVDPGSVVSDWTDTINAAMQEVETAAEDLAGIIATPYASLTYPVPLGKYTYYNGGLYRCISPIASSESWTAAHWTSVKLGDDVSNLKSATDAVYNDVLSSVIDRNYTVENVINHLSSNPTSNSSFGSAPYAPVTSLTDFVVTKVKAYIVTPGFFSIGVYNGDIVAGEAYNASKAVFYAKAVFTDTGVQEAELDVPVIVGKGQKLIYGVNGIDTVEMKYRGTGTKDAGFYRISSGKFVLNEYACGIDFICKKYYGTNIFDTKNSILGYYINDDGKQKKATSALGATDFLYIGCFDKLYIKDPSGTGSSFKGAFYNAKKQYISGISLTSAQKTAGTVVDIPSGAVYAKLSYHQGDESGYLICGSQANDKTEKGFDSAINYPKLLHDVFSTDGATSGKYIDGDGELHDSSSSSVTDYIDISAFSNPLRIIANWTAEFHCASFDSSKVCNDGIDTSVVAGVPYEWELPEGTKYVRISYKTDQANEIKAYMLTDKEQQTALTGKAEAPSGNYENFTYTVPTGIANNDTTATTLQDSATEGTDRGLIVFPGSYSANGKPTRLLICQPGTSGHITSSTTTTQNTVIPADIACAEGFACLEVNGTPGVESTVGSNGNPVFLRCILAAYKYVTEKYNIATDGVFITGYSQGSLCGMQIITSGQIPVLGAAFYGPDLDLWKIEYTYKNATVKEKICDEFGFTEKTASPLVVSLNLGFNDGETVTEPSNYSQAQTVPGNHEKAYILNNIEKWVGYDPMTARFGNGNPGMLYSIWSKYDADPATGEDALYNGNILLPCPVKLFVGTSDAVTTLKYSKWFQRMAVNGGSKCDLRVYNGIDHSGYKTGTDTITVTTKDGQSLSTRVDVWEGLMFFRKFNA